MHRLRRGAGTTHKAGGKALMTARDTRIGQFDKSFVIRTLRDFFVSLLVITGVVLGFNYWLTLQRFQDEGAEQTRYAAERLADDVRQIMLNEGGPVASRTVYPILRRNHERLGLEIAITPSPVTVSSIEKRFDFTPSGLSPNWPESGPYQEHTVELSAESVCLQCHTDAGVGDVLGRVTVRSYLGPYLQNWWQNTKTNVLVSLVDIVVGTLIVFFLLRTRMEPLLSLRSAVARMAKGEMQLNERVPVRSEDEFGELAYDLNRLLVRVCEMGEEMSELLSEETTTDTRIADLIEETEGQLAALRARLREAATRCFPEGERGADGGGVEADLAARIEALGHGRDAQADTAGELQAVLERVRSLAARHEQLGRTLAEASGDFDELERTLGRLQGLTERLRKLVESERRLLERMG